MWCGEKHQNSYRTTILVVKNQEEEKGDYARAPLKSRNQISEFVTRRAQRRRADHGVYGVDEDPRGWMLNPFLVSPRGLG